MASPGHHHPTFVHLQYCMDAAEDAAIARWTSERSRPLTALLAEIVRDGARAAEIRARLDVTLASLRG
ncbi:MAG TPA: hypothetical protein VFC09_13345 [Candidatus Dormibacteraeota bacterium]|nr:hypothetical protein [Candidatus Dormibacteraeota bacterium]